MIYTLEIEPRPTPRPRLGRNGAYNPTDYTNYKESLIWLLKASKLPPGEYGELIASFYIPYPKSTPKKLLIDNVPHVKTPDCDNFLKGLKDSLQQAGIIENDSQLHSCTITKKYTLSKPRIELELK